MQQASLNQLNDIVEPSVASWWPPAWPLLLIVAIVLATVVVIISWLWRRHQQRRPQRIALAKLRQTSLSSSEITLLCKQVALAYYPRERIASLSSRAWLRFLGAEQLAQTKPLLAEAEQLLYAHANEKQQQQYQALAEHWLSQPLPSKVKAGGGHV